jgi:antitoxin (DNA-binding transcriptional repressor) of toxin-antitoxin stability system
MQKTNISNLKNRLSSYLRKVQAGETILVVDRNRPIARIERVGGSAGQDERLVRLEAAGLIRRAAAPLPRKMLSEKLPQARASVLEALLADRSEDR